MDTHDLIWWFAGLAPGLLLGWKLARRRTPTPPSAPVEAAPPQTRAPPAPPVVAASPPPAPVPQAVAAVETPPAAAVEPAPPAPPVEPAIATVEPAWPSDIQALFDQGDTVEAIMQIRATLGGPVARKAAREYLRSGSFSLPVDVRKLVDDGRKLDAIRRLCDQTHMDMTIAQDLIEKYAARIR